MLNKVKFCTLKIDSDEMPKKIFVFSSLAPNLYKKKLINEIQIFRLPEWRCPSVDSIDFSTMILGYSTNFLPADFYQTYAP